MRAHPYDLQPLHQTSQAIATLQAHSGGDLLLQLRDQARNLRLLVPDLIAVSVSTTDPGITLTLVVSRERMANLHALRSPAPYDPPEHIDHAGHAVRAVRADLLSEWHWRQGVRPLNADGIGSTLTMPIIRDGDVVGCVDLYAHRVDAFHGLHDELAAVCGTWGPGAVGNADLSFTTMHAARRAPAALADSDSIAIASGFIAVRDNITLVQALDVLLDTSRTAGVDPAQLARLITAGPVVSDCA